MGLTKMCGENYFAFGPSCFTSDVTFFTIEGCGIGFFGTLGLEATGTPRS